MRRAPGLAALAGLALLLQAGCASLPTDAPRTPSVAFTDTAGSTLGQASQRLLAAHPDLSGVLLLGRGTDAFLARLALAEVAERSLDIQYYIWHGDTTGKVLAASVLRAAERGVRVRVLLDDLGSAASDRNLLAVDSHPNIEVRLFNPLATRSARMLGMLGDFSRVNRRMHNKSFTADNQATIVGGRNIGDEYFEARPDVEFADLDVLAMGPVVGEVSRQFDAYWNSPHAYPITALAKNPPGEADVAAARADLLTFVHAQRDGAYAKALQASGLASRLAEGRLELSAAKVRVVADDPAKIGQQQEDAGPLLLPQLLPEFASLRTELILVSPYFVPGEQGVAHLRALADRGVKVRVLTNSLASTDVPAVHAGYQRYRRALLDAGVALHELKPTAMHHTMPAGEGKAGLSGSSHASLHAKTLMFDRRALFIGSMNLDPRSVFTNTEIGVVVEHPGLAARQAEQLVARLPEISYRLEPAADGSDGIEWVSIEAGEEVRFTREPQTRAWQRFKIRLYSLLPIEHLL